MTLIELLSSYEYKKALFYTNFGVPFNIIDFDDKKMIDDALNLIDNHNIYYYDIFAIPDLHYEKYSLLFDNELKWKSHESFL